MADLRPPAPDALPVVVMREGERRSFGPGELPDRFVVRVEAEERFPDPRFERWRPSRMSNEVVEGEAIAYRAALKAGLTRDTFFAWLVSRRYVGGWNDMPAAEPKRLGRKLRPLG